MTVDEIRRLMAEAPPKADRAQGVQEAEARGREFGLLLARAFERNLDDVTLTAVRRQERRSRWTLELLRAWGVISRS